MDDPREQKGSPRAFTDIVEENVRLTLERDEWKRRAETAEKRAGDAIDSVEFDKLESERDALAVQNAQMRAALDACVMSMCEGTLAEENAAKFAGETLALDTPRAARIAEARREAIEKVWRAATLLEAHQAIVELRKAESENS